MEKLYCYNTFATINCQLTRSTCFPKLIPNGWTDIEYKIFTYANEYMLISLTIQLIAFHAHHAAYIIHSVFKRIFPSVSILVYLQEK